MEADYQHGFFCKISSWDQTGLGGKFNIPRIFHCVPAPPKPSTRHSIQRVCQGPGSSSHQSLLPMWDAGDLFVETRCLRQTSLQCLQALLQGPRNSKAPKLAKGRDPEEKKVKERGEPGRALNFTQECFESHSD